MAEPKAIEQSRSRCRDSNRLPACIREHALDVARMMLVKWMHTYSVQGCRGPEVSGKLPVILIQIKHVPTARSWTGQVASNGPVRARQGFARPQQDAGSEVGSRRLKKREQLAS